MIRKNVLIIFTILSIISLSIIENVMHAARRRMIMIKHESKFERIKSRNDFLCVLFYNDDKCIKSEIWRHNVKTLQELYKDTSNRALYKDSGLLFVMMNTKFCSVNMLADEYFVGQTPSIVLFKFGYPVAQPRNNIPVQLKGFVSASTIHRFIQKHLGSDLEKTIREKRAENRYLARQRRLWDSSYNFYPYYGYYGWPLYNYGFGSPYYYGHPRVGIGIGFHL